MDIQRINKSREEQDRDFREAIGHYANPKCKYCLGTGKEYWLVALGQYKVCECVLENIKTIKERGLN